MFELSSRMGNLVINPSGGSPGEIETYLRFLPWWLLDLSRVWDFPQLRGENEIIPGAIGRRANPLRIDQTTYVMPFHILGTVTASGSATAIPGDPFDGLRANLDYLFENVHNPLTTTRLAKLILPNLTELTAEVQVTIALGVQTITEARAVVSVTVPAGRFT